MTPDHRDRSDGATVHDLFDYDAELRHYHERLRTAIDVRPAGHVLDIGCGTGQTTRAAARAAISGSALGIDISAPMLARARQLSLQEGLRNVSFVQAVGSTRPAGQRSIMAVFLVPLWPGGIRVAGP